MCSAGVQLSLHHVQVFQRSTACTLRFNLCSERSLQSALQLVTSCCRSWDIDSLRAAYRDMCAKRSFDVDCTGFAPEEVMDAADKKHVAADGNDAAQGCANLLSQVQQHAQMELQGLEAPPPDQLPEDLELEELPDAAELKRLLKANTLPCMKPFSTEGQHGPPPTLHAALCLGMPWLSLCSFSCLGLQTYVVGPTSSTVIVRGRERPGDMFNSLFRLLVHIRSGQLGL